MTSTAPKLRIVKCPKCLRLLLEAGDLPVYQCGGCRAILKAKNYKVLESVNSEARNNNSAEKSEHDSEDQESSSSKQGEVLCSTGACEQLESGDCNNENSESRSVTTGVPSSGDLTCHEEERLPSEAGEKKADGNNGTTPNSQTPSSGGNRTFERPSEENFLLQANRSLRSSSKKSAHDFEDREFASPRQRAILYSTGACERFESGSRKNENSGSGRVPVGIASSGDLSCHEEEGSFSEAGEKKESYGKNVTTSNSQHPSPGGKLISGGSSSTSTSERQSDDNTSLHINNAVSNEQFENSQRVVYHAPDDTRSRDTEETTEPTDDSIISEEDMFDTGLSNSLEDSSKPKPNRRRYQAYDGSISSCDGLDDQAFEPERAAAFVAPRQRHRRGDVAVNNKITNKAQRQESRLSLISSYEKTGPVAMDSNQNGLLRPARIREEAAGARCSEEFNPVKSWLELGREDILSQDPCSSAGSENSDPLNYRRGDYLSSTSLYPPNKLDLVERNQMELLKKVDELTDKLNRSYAHNGKATTRFPTRSSEQENPWPRYYNHKTPDQDMLQQYDVNYPQRSREIYGVRSMVSKQSSPSCGVRANGYEDEEDRQDLQKLPQPNMGYNEGTYRAYPGHIWYTPYSSSPSSPQQRPLPSHNPLRGHDTPTQPHDRIDVYQKTEKLHHRERRSSVKRHCLPIAGASPFIICYSCSRLLQLPSDFLVSSKRRHLLQCRSCSEVLVFSVHRGTRLLPYSSNSAAAPKGGNSSTASNVVASPSREARVSYSEDCGDCSGSTEGGRSTYLTTPTFSPFQRKTVNKRQPSSSSSKPEKGKRKPPAYKQKNSIEPSDCESSSPKDAKLKGTEMRRPHAEGPSLHRLMGYCSAREIMNAPDE